MLPPDGEVYIPRVALDSVAFSRLIGLLVLSGFVIFEFHGHRICIDPFPIDAVIVEEVPETFLRFERSSSGV